MENSNIDTSVEEDTSVDTTKCNKCGIEIPKNQINEHDMRCSYAFNIADFENLIPCELCQELISFEDYESHTRNCSNSYRRLGNNLNIYNSFGATAGTADANIEDVQSQLNNDPVVRALFNFMVGQPLPTSHPPEDLNDSIDSDTANVPSNPLIGLLNNLSDGATTDATDGGGGATAGATGGATAGAGIHPINPFLEFLQSLPNPPNDIPNIESFLNNIVVTPLPFDTNTNEQMNYEDLANLDDVEVGISNIDLVSELQFSECDCPICCQPCLLTRKTKCGHIYCDTCLTEWLKTNKKCPTCMIELE